MPQTTILSRPRMQGRLARCVVPSLLIGGALALPTGASAGGRPTAPSTTPTVLSWFDTTVDALRVANLGYTGTTQITASDVWATAWTAADDAVARVSVSRWTGLRVDPRAGQSQAQQAAVATAVHDVLASAVPAQRSTNDAALASTLASLPAGPARAAGEAAGHSAATKWIAARTGDGLDQASVNAPFTPPPAGLGVWQPTLPTFAPAVLSAQGKGKPFVLDQVAKRFVASPPPKPGSRTAIADLEESLRLGGVDSADRTPAQTHTAKFWSQASIQGFTTILRAVVADDRRGLADQVGLISTFHRVTTDAQIAVYASKYRYVAWRPVTALRFDDADPSTPYDASFVPLIPTPAHPEYPSGHVGYAAAAERVLRALVGPAPTAPITATSTATPDAPITYTRWDQITQDNVDARVWSGIHFRSTDEYTRRFGAKVADAALRTLGSSGRRP